VGDLLTQTDPQFVFGWVAIAVATIVGLVVVAIRMSG
jgi:hypothetical protein